VKYLIYLLISIGAMVALLRFSPDIGYVHDKNESKNTPSSAEQISVSDNNDVSSRPKKRAAGVIEISSGNIDTNIYKEPTPRELLENGEFDEVLAIYSSESGAQKSVYESALVEYLTILAVQNPVLAKKQLLSFMEVSPDNRPVMEAMVELYESEKKNAELVELLKNLRENYAQDSNDGLIMTQIHQAAKKQIEYLANNQDYQNLMPFLYDMIEYDDLGGYYSLELAQNYSKMGKTDDALNILESLQYDRKYAMKAREIKDR